MNYYMLLQKSSQDVTVTHRNLFRTSAKLRAFHHVLNNQHQVTQAVNVQKVKHPEGSDSLGPAHVQTHPCF